VISVYGITSTSVYWDKEGNPADYLTEPICGDFRGFSLEFACVGA